MKSRNLTTVLRHLLDDFKAAYWNVYVLKWSAWWSFSACGYYFVSSSCYVFSVPIFVYYFMYFRVIYFFVFLFVMVDDVVGLNLFSSTVERYCETEHS